MYHEKQDRQMCLVHALNALLQTKEFTSSSLDQLCYSLDDRKWFNPHKSMLGLGNYDVNVLILALQKHNLYMTWFDSRMSVNRIDLDKVHGMIINIPSTTMIPFMKGRHWYTVLKRDDGIFFNLDSKIQAPKEIPDILEYCSKIIGNQYNNNQLMLISKSDVNLILPEHSSSSDNS